MRTRIKAAAAAIESLLPKGAAAAATADDGKDDALASERARPLGRNKSEEKAGWICNENENEILSRATELWWLGCGCGRRMEHEAQCT